MFLEPGPETLNKNKFGGPKGIRPMKLIPRADSPWTVPMTVEVALKRAA